MLKFRFPLLVLAAVVGRTVLASPAPDTLLVVGDAPTRSLEKSNRLLFDGLAARGFAKQRYVPQNELRGKDLETAKLVLFFGGASPNYSLAGHDRRVRDALVAYVRGGGGLVVFPMMGQRLNLSAFTEHLMNAFDGGILMESPAIPKERYVEVGIRGRNHLYTNRIFVPGTRASNVLFNATHQFNTSHQVQGCRVGDGWKLLLSAGADIGGMPFPETGVSFWDERRSDTPVKGDYPVVAARRFGKGRVVWWGMSGYFLISDTRGDRAVAEKMRAILFDGIAGHPKSDTFELMSEVFSWAAGDGKKRDEPSGEILSLKTLAEEEDALGRDWRFFRGVVGPRTVYSSGKSTPAEYVAKAKALGHDFIVFLEDFKCLAPEGFAALLRDCEALTDDTFTAWGGYTIENEDGNKEFVITREAMYPGRIFLTADGKRLAKRVRRSNGAIATACTELQFYYGAYGFNCNVGWYDFKNSPYRRTDLRAAFSMGVIERDNGVEKTRSLDAYAINCDNNQSPMPVALEFMESADSLDEKSFVLQVGANGLAAMRKVVGGPEAWTIFSGYPGMGTFGNYSISSGPAVKFDIPRCDPADDGSGLYNPKLSRWPFSLLVRSPAGVGEVQLWDGDRLARRWNGGGKRVFDISGTLSAECQHHYWVRAKDNASGEAITRAAGCVSLLLSEFNCGDRMNQYLDAVQKRGNGEPPFVMQRGGETCLPDKGPWTGRVRPVGCFVFDKKWGLGGSGGGDGSPEDHPQLKLTPSIAYGGEKPASLGWTSEFVAGRAGGPHAEPRRVVASANALVADRVLDGTFPLAERDVVHVWRSLLPVADCPWAETVARNSLFLPKIDGIVAYQWEQTLTLKRDIPASPDGCASVGFGSVVRSKHTVSFNAHLRGKTVSSAFAKSFDMLPGDAIVAKDSIWGSLAVIALTPARYESGRFFAPDSAAAIRAGTTFAFKVALIGMHKGVEDPDAFTMEEIIPKYAAFAPQGGVIRDEAAQDGAIVETFCELDKLPGTLGLRLSGLADNRSAVLALPDGRVRLIPVEKGVAYVALGDEESGKELFIGHPVKCDNPDVGLYLTLGKDLKTWQLEIHNPTANAVTAHVFSDTRFLLFPVEKTFQLSAFSSTTMSLGKGAMQ